MGRGGLGRGASGTGEPQARSLTEKERGTTSKGYKKQGEELGSGGKETAVIQVACSFPAPPSSPRNPRSLPRGVGKGGEGSAGKEMAVVQVADSSLVRLPAAHALLRAGFWVKIHTSHWLKTLGNTRRERGSPRKGDTNRHLRPG